MGGILGLLMSPLIFIISVVALIFGGARGGALLALTIVGFLAAIAGIVGAVVSRRRTISGGLTMLVSGVLPLSLAIEVLSFLSVGTMAVLILFLYFWAILLSLGGLMSLTKPRPSRL